LKPQLTSTGSKQPDNLIRWNEINSKVLAGNVSYGATMENATADQNLNIWKAQGTSPSTANTEFVIAHQLGRIPNTIVGQDTNNGGLLYRSSTTWTSTMIYLKCTTASAAYKVIVA
jgi:hypothetical protein